MSAPGIDVDFVSRFLPPSSECQKILSAVPLIVSLHPTGAHKLGKNVLHAKQVSKRGGNLYCEVSGDRVLISSEAVTVMKTQIVLDRSTR